MKFKSTVPVIILALVISSCGNLAHIQKRRYRAGYYVPERCVKTEKIKQRKDAIVTALALRQKYIGPALPQSPVESGENTLVSGVPSKINVRQNVPDVHLRKIKLLSPAIKQIMDSKKEVDEYYTERRLAKSLYSKNTSEIIDEGSRTAASFATGAVLLFLLSLILILFGGLLTIFGIVCLIVSAIFAIAAFKNARRVLKAHPEGGHFPGKGRTIYALTVGIIGLVLLSIGLLLLIFFLTLLFMFGL